MANIKELEKRLEAEGWRFAGLFEFPSSISFINRMLRPFGLKIRTKTSYAKWGDGIWLLVETDGRKELEQKIRQVITYYSAGVEDGHYEQLMDELTQSCTDEQWQEVCRVIDEVDVWMAETDKATLAQKERLAALREGRSSRYPGVLVRTLMSKDEINAILRELEEEHGVKAEASEFA